MAKKVQTRANCNSAYLKIFVKIFVGAVAFCLILGLTSSIETILFYVLTNNVAVHQVLAEIKQPVTSKPVEAEIGMPKRIKIPNLKIDALIERVSLAKDGSMAVPKDPLNAGWYELGVRPGEIGSAVIDGHVNWWNGATGVFADLNNVKEGDRISVQDEINGITSFVVRQIRIYDAVSNASDVFNSSDGKSHLNLITCTGAWNKREKQYSKRLIVFADKE